MLQYLADVIFFWFTQTIKPLSFDHIVRILKNEMYRLPYKTIHYDIAEEVAKNSWLCTKNAYKVILAPSIYSGRKACLWRALLRKLKGQ
ncbi:hypothetical protein P8452_21778 [Trifolium repens]|nr:hypothetical protein P8452_21778 [Trifolium repens]